MAAPRVFEVKPAGCGHVSSEIANGSGRPADYQQYVEDRGLSSTMVYLRAAVLQRCAIHASRIAPSVCNESSPVLGAVIHSKVDAVAKQWEPRRIGNGYGMVPTIAFS
jgi:hypothetical protein